MPDPISAAASCVFVTTPTSGSESFWRILSGLSEGVMKPVPEWAVEDRYAHRPPFRDMRPEEVAAWVPADTGCLYMYRRTQIPNEGLRDRSRRIIVNFRDPRDIACNHFHWEFVHPQGETPEEGARRLAWVKAHGIDGYVLRAPSGGPRDHPFNFNALLDLGERLLSPDSNVLIVSYAQLCCDFDGLLERLSHFLGARVQDDTRMRLDLERAERLGENPHWIGQIWAGTDIAPGRFRRELRPETIEALNDQTRDLRNFLKTIEIPALRSQYDD